jgi:hypothetical protein
MKESSGHAMQVIVPRTAMSFSVTSGGQHFRPVSVTSPMLDRYRDGYGGHSSDIYIIYIYIVNLNLSNVY